LKRSSGEAVTLSCGAVEELLASALDDLLFFFLDFPDAVPSSGVVDDEGGGPPGGGPPGGRPFVGRVVAAGLGGGTPVPAIGAADADVDVVEVAAGAAVVVS
jgi:hypothetical protein